LPIITQETPENMVSTRQKERDEREMEKIRQEQQKKARLPPHVITSNGTQYSAMDVKVMQEKFSIKKAIPRKAFQRIVKDALRSSGEWKISRDAMETLQAVAESELIRTFADGYHFTVLRGNETFLQVDLALPKKLREPIKISLTNDEWTSIFRKYGKEVQLVELDERVLQKAVNEGIIDKYDDEDPLDTTYYDHPFLLERDYENVAFRRPRQEEEECPIEFDEESDYE
jgi:histone H3/H4